jgi:hypothetical protein
LVISGVVIADLEGGFYGKCQEMAQKAHGKAQAQEEAQAHTVAASKDRALDELSASHVPWSWIRIG